MREIKFRAWINEKDKGYSRMVHSEQAIVTILGHKYGGKGVAKPAGFSDIDNQPKPERYVLMQYTGLKDKNGREIYEGDIVLFSGDDKELIKKMTVEWTEAEFVLLIDTKDWAYSLSGTPSSCLEVIGNIFEHKELLEVKK